MSDFNSLMIALFDMDKFNSCNNILCHWQCILTFTSSDAPLPRFASEMTFGIDQTVFCISRMYQILRMTYPPYSLKTAIKSICCP